MRYLALLLIACGCGGKPHAATTPAHAKPAASDGDAGDQSLIDRQDAAALAHNMPIIRAHVLSYSSAFRACYERALKDTPGLSGEVTVHFTVTGDGTVADAVGSGMNAAISTCCASVMYGVHFPPTVTGGSIDVNYPFQFHTDAAPASSSPVVTVGSTPATPADTDKVMIRTQIRAHMDRIKYCYEKQLISRPNLTGQVLVHFVITKEGSVSSSVGSGLDPAVASCVADAISHLTFPRPGHVINVNYPFDFQSAQSAGSAAGSGH